MQHVIDEPIEFKDERTIEEQCNQTAHDFLVAITRWHLQASGKKKTSFAEILGLSVIVLADFSFDAITNTVEGKDEQKPQI